MTTMAFQWSLHEESKWHISHAKLLMLHLVMVSWMWNANCLKH